MELVSRLGRFAAQLAAMLLLVSAVTFLLVSISPLDPVSQYVAGMARTVSDEQVSALRGLWGEGQPLWRRYLEWLTHALTGDLGVSYLQRRSVSALLWEGFVNSLALMAVAWVLSTVGGYLLGLFAGARRGRWADRLIVTLCFVLSSTPTYVLGLVLMMILAVQLGWMPVGLSQPLGMLSQDVTWSDRLYHLILPALSVALVSMSALALHTREALVELFDTDIVRFARARGLSTRQIVLTHGVRHTAVPALVLQLSTVSVLVGGSALAEVVFSYHGLGLLITQSAVGSDVPVLLGAVVASAAIVIVGNRVADAVARRLDYRILQGDRRVAL